MIKLYEIKETTTIVKSEKYGNWNLGGDANISIGYSFGDLRNPIDPSSRRADDQPILARAYMKFDIDKILSDYTTLIGLNFTPKYYLNLWLADTKRTRNIDYNFSIYRIDSNNWTTGDGQWDNHVLKNDDWGANYSYAKIEDDIAWAKKDEPRPPGVSDGVGMNIISATLHNAWSIDSRDQFKNRYRYPDLKVEITDWIQVAHTEVEKDGFNLKYGIATQLDTFHHPSGSVDWGILNFYSANTDTPFVPFILCEWDDSQLNYGDYIGTITEITLNNNIVVEAVEPREWYDMNETAKMYINARVPWNILDWEVPTYTTGSNENYKFVDHYLPEHSYYQIHLISTNDIIIPWSVATKLARDERGSYINLPMSNFHSYLIYGIQLICFDTDLSGKRYVYSVENGNFKVK